MANDFEGRLKGLEDREAILYQYIDEVRANSVKLDRQHEEMLKRMAENEERIGQNEGMLGTLVGTQGMMLQRIEQNEQMMGRLVETQGMMLQLLERMDQKLDNLGKPGTNGHT